MRQPAKFATIFAIAALVMFGLCGVGTLHSLGGGDTGWSRLAGAGFFGFVVCAVGLVVSLVWMAVGRKGE